MADILIRGMDMPKYTVKAEFGIDADGNPLCMVYHEDGTEPDIYDVVPLPNGHGRLKDSRYIIDTIQETYCSACVCSTTSFNCQLCKITKVIGIIENAQTIVPAEGGTDPPTKSVAKRWVVIDTGWKCPFCGGEIDAEIQWLVSPEFPKYCPQCGKRLVLHNA